MKANATAVPGIPVPRDARDNYDRALVRRRNQELRDSLGKLGQGFSDRPLRRNGRAVEDLDGAL